LVAERWAAALRLRGDGGISKICRAPCGIEANKASSGSRLFRRFPRRNGWDDVRGRFERDCADEVRITRRAPHHYSCSALRVAGRDTSFSRECAMPTVIPSLEHVTWRERMVTPSRLAISSRSIPCATSSLIFAMTCGVNRTGLFIITAPQCPVHNLRLVSDTVCKIETPNPHSLKQCCVAATMFAARRRAS
jgi:hypothetical protein